MVELKTTLSKEGGAWRLYFEAGEPGTIEILATMLRDTAPSHRLALRPRYSTQEGDRLLGIEFEISRVREVLPDTEDTAHELWRRGDSEAISRFEYYGTNWPKLPVTHR